MTTYKVGYLIGSLATGSINRKFVMALVKLSFEPIVLGDLAAIIRKPKANPDHSTPGRYPG